MNPSDAARALGKLGASKGGKARAAKLSKARRAAIAKAGGIASAIARRSKQIP